MNPNYSFAAWGFNHKNKTSARTQGFFSLSFRHFAMHLSLCSTCSMQRRVHWVAERRNNRMQTRQLNKSTDIKPVKVDRHFLGSIYSLSDKWARRIVRWVKFSVIACLYSVKIEWLQRMALNACSSYSLSPCKTYKLKALWKTLFAVTITRY